MPLFPLYIAFGAAAVLLHRRWGWYGLAGLALTLAFATVIAGHLDFVSPHTHPVPKGNHWACDSLGYVPPIGVASLAVALGLVVVGWLGRATIQRQMVAVGLCLVAAIPAIVIVQVFFVTMVWGCDTL
jgi:hypothetical protein